MIFAQPTPFAEAAASHEVRALLPTSLGSAELVAQLGQDVLRRSLFAARLDHAGDVQWLKDQIGRLIDGKGDFASVRTAWQARLDARGYLPPTTDEEGTITDLRSERRANLILQTNVQMAQGYGRFVQGQDPAILDHWPAQELYRQEERQEHRHWPTIWREHGGAGKMFGQNPDYPEAGRMIALKDDPIWVDISQFGNPYPPFAFGSGMSVRDITRTEAIALGLLQPGQRVNPQVLPFNHGLEAGAINLDEALRETLTEEGYTIQGDKVTLGPQPEASIPALPSAPNEAAPAPAGTPISASLDFDASAPNRAILRRAQELVDGVHGDGVLPRVQVDAQTRYYEDLGDHGLGESNLERIGVNPHASVAEQTAAYVHEMGHNLDTWAFGNDPAEWASEMHPDLEEWRQAVIGTDAYARLDAALQAARFVDPQGDDARYFQYCYQAHELFARSYVQYIAVCSGDATLLDGLARVAAGTDYFQWQAGDFAPVAAAFDALFARKGWRTP